MLVKYVALHPDETPVRTIYPHVSVIGGHREEIIDIRPARINTEPQNCTGANCSKTARAICLPGVAPEIMYCNPTSTNSVPLTSKIVLWRFHGRRPQNLGDFTGSSSSIRPDPSPMAQPPSMSRLPSHRGWRVSIYHQPKP